MAIGPLQTGNYSCAGNCGGGYAPGDTGIFSQVGGGSGATYTVNTVGGDAEVMAFTVDTGGSGYDSTGDPFLNTTNTSGTGSGFAPTVSQVPVISGTGGGGPANSFH